MMGYASLTNEFKGLDQLRLYCDQKYITTVYPYWVALKASFKEKMSVRGNKQTLIGYLEMLGRGCATPWYLLARTT
jgi:hypothetical protein